MTDARAVVAVELAAGGGSRFGGGKLVALLDGRPLVAHAATAALACGIPDLVVVLGAQAAEVEAALVADGTLPLPGERSPVTRPTATVTTVVNEDWASGIASSVARGLHAAAAAAPGAEAALILLGDQPRVDPGTIARLLAVGVDDARPFAVARAEDGSGGNPVLVDRSAWARADGLTGDRGFGPFLTVHPELVTFVEPVSANPDVDTPEDLATLASEGLGGPAASPGASADPPRSVPQRAEAVWRSRVLANDAQSARVRETPEPVDFYGPVAGIFVVDPRRTDDAVLDVLLALARPDDRWLDIGAGAGRFALPLALRVREVVALDPSPSMLGALGEGMERHGIANVATVSGRWPADPDVMRSLRSDVALVAHVGYDIAEIGAFVDAMESAAGRLCVAVMSSRVPAWPAGRFWPPVHREARIELPALRPFVEVLRERGADPSVVERPHQPRAWPSRDDLHAWIRHQLFLAEGSERDRQARDLVDRWTVEVPDGVILEHQAPATHAVVSWVPRRH